MMELKYKIVRSPKRKKLTITVERDRTVIVHAPEGVSEDEVRRVVDAKRQWIFEKLRHPQKYQDRLHPPGKEVVNGESAPYLGRDYRIEVTERRRAVRWSSSQFFLVPPAHQAKRREVLRDWYIARAKEKILARVKQHARELGVEFGSARIVDNRYRWGSCTVNDNVSFQLASHQGADVRHRLRDRPRARSPYRSQPHGPLLEHRPRKDAHDGKGKGLAEGAWTSFRRGSLAAHFNCGWHGSRQPFADFLVDIDSSIDTNFKTYRQRVGYGCF